MSRKERLVHHIALIALIANLFAPLFAMENVFAQDPLPGQESQPTVDYDAPAVTDGESAPAGDTAPPPPPVEQAPAEQPPAVQPPAEQPPAEQPPVVPQVTKIAPQDPVITGAICVDLNYAPLSFPGMPTTTWQIEYKLLDLYGSGTYSLTAKILTADTAWQDDGSVINWRTNADFPGLLIWNTGIEPCPPPAPEPAPEVVYVAPVDVAIGEATCVNPDTLTFDGMPASTDQIAYGLLGPNEAGAYTVTATMLTTTSWENNGAFANWTVWENGVATFNTTIAPCDVVAPEPEVAKVTPQDPTIGEASCVDITNPTVFDGMPTSTDQVTYALTGPDADGKYTLTATLVGDTAWDANGAFANWTIDAATNVATFNTLIDPCPADKDGDKILDDVDNCPEIANEDQADTDEDKIGDACDDVDDREMSMESQIRAIDKDGNEVTEAIPGATIVFEITITNTGETDIDNLAIDPSLELQELACVDGEGNTVELVDVVEPEQTILCTGTYKVHEVGEVDAEAETQVGPQMRTMSAPADADTDSEGEKGEDVKLEIEVSGLSVPAENSIAPAVQIMTAAGITLPGGVTPYTNSNYRVDFAGYNCVSGSNGKYADCVVSVDPGRYHRGNSTSEAYACKINNNSSASWTTSGTPRVYSGGTWSGALGAPDGDNTANPDGTEPSIGWKGILVVQFTDNRLIADGNTATKDLKIWERGSEPEPSAIYVSNNGTNWIWVGELSGSQNTAIQEFNIDGVGGIQTGDIFQYVMIIDLDRKSYEPCSSSSSLNRAGADIDSIEALSSVLHPVAPTVIAQECKNGVATTPSVAFATSPTGVAYAWDSGTDPSMTPGTTFKVRATITATTAIWPNNLGEGWVRVSDKVATWQHTFAAKPCTDTTMPTITPVQAVCTGSTPGSSSVTVNTSGQGITSSVSPTSAPGGVDQNFQVTLTLAKGYKWPTVVTSANGWTIENNTQTGISTAKKTFTVPAKTCVTDTKMPPLPTPVSATCDQGAPANHKLTVGKGTADGVKVVSISGKTVLTTNDGFGDYTFPGNTSPNGVVVIELKAGFAWPSDLQGWENVSGKPNQKQKSFAFTAKDCAATITVTKTAGSSTITAGQSASFTITVKNTHATNTAYGVVLKDAVPTGYVWAVTNVTGANANICDALANGQGELNCAIGTLAPGASVAVTITAPTTINPSTCPATITNAQAKVTASNASEKTAGPVSISVICVATFPTITTTNSVCVPGSPITYSGGSIKLAGVVGLQRASIDGGSTWVNPSGGQIVFNNVSGGSYTVTIELANGYTASTPLPSGWESAGSAGKYRTTAQVTVNITPCNPAIPTIGTITPVGCVAGQDTDGRVAVTTLGNSGFTFWIDPGTTFTSSHTFSMLAAGDHTIHLQLNGAYAIPSAEAMTGAGWIPVDGEARQWTQVVNIPDNSCDPSTVPPPTLSIAACVDGATNAQTLTFNPTGVDVQVKLDGSVVTGTNGVYTFDAGDSGNVTITLTLKSGHAWPDGFGNAASAWAVTGTTATLKQPLVLTPAECEPDLAIAKVITTTGQGPDGAYLPGDTISYTITLTNTGAGPANGVSVADILPPGVTMVLNSIAVTGDSSTNCGYTSATRTIECTDIDVPHQTGTGATAVPGVVTISYSITIPNTGTVCGTIDNSATFTLDGQKSNPAVASAKIDCKPGIDVSKGVRIGTSGQFGPTVAITTAPTTVQYQVTVANTGNTTLTNVPFVDTLTNANGSLTMVSMNPANAITWSNPGQTEGTIGSIAKGTSVVVTYSYVVNQTDLDSSTAIQNCATATVSTPVKDTACASVTKTQDPDVSLAKSGNGPLTIGEPGDTIIFTIVVKNEGNVTIQSGQVSEQYLVENMPTLPNGTGWSWYLVPAGGGNASPVDQVIGEPYVFTNLGPGESITLQVHGRVPTSVSLPAPEWCTTFDNTAILTGTYANGDAIGEGSTLTSAPGISASASVDVLCNGVSVKKVAGNVPATVQADDDITFSIIVTNTGNTDQTNVVVTDIPELEALGTVQFGQATLGNPPVNVSTTVNGLEVTITSTIPGGGVVTIPVTYTLTQTDIDRGSVENCAAVGNDVSNPCANADLPQVPHVVFSKTTDDPSVSPGIDNPAVVAFKIEVLNDGNVTLETATITDAVLAGMLPTGAAWTIAVTEGGSYLDQTSAFPFVVSDLEPTGKIVITVSLEVPANIQLPSAEWCKSFDNTANITGTFANDAVVMPDPQASRTTEAPAGISSSASVLVNCTGLDIEKTGPTGDLEPGGDYAYTITVRNNGNTPVYGVTVQDNDIPTWITIGAITPADLCEVDASNVITCDIGTMEAGSADVVITIPFSVPAVGEITWEQCETTLENQAEILGSFSLTDPNQSTVMSRGITLPGADIKSGIVSNDIDCETGITIDKSVTSTDMTVVSPPDRFDAGDEITYSFLITNTGDVTLYNVNVTDLLPGVIFDQPTTGITLEPGVDNALILTATYKITQGEMQLGQNVNCVVVSGSMQLPGTNTPGRGVSDDDCVTTPLPQVPAILVTKTASKDVVVPGETYSYTITIKNTGNVTLLTDLFSDVMPAGTTNAALSSTSGIFCYQAFGSVICAPTVLLPGATASFTVSLKAPAQPSAEVCDATPGLRNVVVVGGVTVAGKVSGTGTADTDIFCEPELTIVKTGPQAPVVPVSPLTFTITVTNSGTYPAAGLTITDSLVDAGVAGLSWADDSALCEITDGVLECDNIAVPAYGGTFQVTITATVDAANLECGEYTNRATLGGDDSEYAEVTFSEQSFEIDCVPAYTVEKTSNGAADYNDVDENGELSEGDVITYRITIENTGNVDLVGLTLNDVFNGLPDPETLVWEDGFNGVDIPTILFGDDLTLVATYTITLDDVNRGDVQNCADVSLTFGDQPLNEEAPCVIDDIPQHPGIIVVKEASSIDMAVELPEDRVDAGDVITYTFVVTNTGNVTLTDIVLPDSLIADGDWGPGGNTIDSLNPTESVQRTATYTVLQSDIDADFIENCVDLSATPPVEDVILQTAVGALSSPFQNGGEAPVNWPPVGDCVTVDELGEPGVDIEKSAEILPGDDGVMDKDDVIRYSFVVTNTGNTTLNNIVVTDPLEGLEWESETTIATLAPGESVTLTATYKVPQAMIDAGLVENCAIVEADGPIVEVIIPQFAAQVVGDDEAPYATDEDCIETPLEPAPGIELLKTGTEATGDDDTLDVDEVITYTFTVTNTGNVTMSDIEIADPMPNLTWSEGGNAIATLAPGESAELTATYVVTQADLDNGTVENCAEASGMAPDETDVDSNESCEIIEVPQEPGISILKSSTAAAGDDDNLDVDEVITYTFTVTNTGNQTLTNVAIADPMVGLTWSDSGSTIATLAPGASVQLTATYVVTQADVNEGMIVNCADITSEAPDQSAVHGEKSCATETIDQDFGLTVAQECPGPVEAFLPTVDQEVEFQVIVTNSGNVTVFNLQVETNREGTFNEPFPTSLAPGESATRTWTIVMTQADVDAREVLAIIEVTGDTEAGESAKLASMVYMQSVGDVESETLTLSCPMGELPKPVPPVGKLPDTGVGSVTGTAPILWAAAMMSIATLGIGALGFRKRAER